MRGAATTAGVLSAAALLSQGCGSEARPSGDREEPVRRAAFRSLAARDFLLTCPAGADRRETEIQAQHYAELKRLGGNKGAGRAIWLGENDWAGVARYGEREPCEPGEAAYLEALAAYRASLDTLAARIAEYRQ